MFIFFVCLFCVFLFLVVFNLFFKKIENFDNHKESIENDLSNTNTNTNTDTNKTSNIDTFYNEKPSEIFIDMFKFSEPWRNGLENDRNDEAINI